MPEITVIVPVYRVEAYIDRCVQSILCQSFRDFELVLVDDGSPDRCGALCDGYAAQDSRVTALHQANGGLSAARNTGIDWAMAHSDSRYLSFVDSDDWVSPFFLEELYTAARTLDCPVSACGVARTAGEPLPPGPPAAPRRLSADDYYCGQETSEVAWNKLYDRRLFSSLRYPQGRLHEDEFTTYQAVYAAGAVALVPQPLYAYFQNPGSITGSRWSRGRMDALTAFERQIAFARERDCGNLLRKAALSLIYGAYDQLPQADKESRRHLRRCLRSGLAVGRETGCFPMKNATLWAYEAAYPCKPVWFALSRLGNYKKE